ncbi:MAG: hypothetical protein VCG02_14595 [Verrucomicrobiota bacterium]
MDYDDDDKSIFDTSENDYEEEVTPIECPSCGEELDPVTCTGVCPECGEEVEIPPKEKEKGKYDEDDEENVALEDLIGEDEEVEKIISNGEDIPAEDLVDEDYTDKGDEKAEEEEEEEEEIEAEEKEDEESYYYE